jgi:hypothetical protein
MMKMMAAIMTIAMMMMRRRGRRPEYDYGDPLLCHFMVLFLGAGV